MPFQTLQQAFQAVEARFLGLQLAVQAHGDEQALPQGAEHEYRGDEQQRPHRAPVRHAEQGHGGQRAQAHAEHAHAVIGNEFAEQHLPAAHGRGQHGLHGAALPLAGKDQRGQQGTDERHDDRDGPGYQKALALGRGIVPVALLYAHRAGLRHPACRAPCQRSSTACA